MTKTFEITVRIQSDDNPENWLLECIADLLMTGENILSFTTIEVKNEEHI
jgi:hypothetical protein